MARSLTLAAAITAAALILSRPVSAQEALTLDDALRQAAAHNRAIEMSRTGVTEADAGLAAARAAFFPRLSFSESWQRGDQPVFVFGSLLSSRQFAASNFAIDALNHPDPVGFFHGAFGIEQLLFDGGRRESQLDAASRRREIAALGVTQAGADIALAVTQGYGRLLAVRASARAADGAVASAAEDLRRAESLRDAGMATDADVLALTVHSAAMQARAIQARGDAAAVRADLNRLMGRPVQDDFTPQEPAVAAIPTPDIPALLTEAESARPEIKRADAEQRLAQGAVRMARAAWWPQVGAQAGYELNGMRFTDRASAWVVGGQLSWSLSTGGGEIASQRAAAAALARASTARDDVRAAVQAEVVAAVSRLEAAKARERVGRSAVDQAREAQRIIRERFEAGLAGVTDVLRAATAVLDADAQRTGALVDALTADAMLRHAAGRQP